MPHLYSFVEFGQELCPTPRLSNTHTSLPVHSTSWLSHVRSSMPLPSDSSPSVPPSGTECSASIRLLAALFRLVAAVLPFSSRDGAALLWQSLLSDGRSWLLGVSVPASASSCGRHASWPQANPGEERHRQQHNVQMQVSTMMRQLCFVVPSHWLEATPGVGTA